MLITYLQGWDFPYLCAIYSQNKILSKKNQNKTAEAVKWKIPYLLFNLDCSYQGCFTIYRSMFIPHSSVSQEWHFSQLNQGRTAAKSHQPMQRKSFLHRLGRERRAHFNVWLLPLPSFLGRAGMVLFMQPQVGRKTGGTGPNLDLGNHCNVACHFKYFSYALPKLQHV